MWKLPEDFLILKGEEARSRSLWQLVVAAIQTVSGAALLTVSFTMAAYPLVGSTATAGRYVFPTRYATGLLWKYS